MCMHVFTPTVTIIRGMMACGIDSIFPCKIFVIVINALVHCCLLRRNAVEIYNIIN